MSAGGATGVVAGMVPMPGIGGTAMGSQPVIGGGIGILGSAMPGGRSIPGIGGGTLPSMPTIGGMVGGMSGGVIGAGLGPAGGIAPRSQGSWGSRNSAVTSAGNGCMSPPGSPSGPYGEEPNLPL